MTYMSATHQRRPAADGARPADVDAPLTLFGEAIYGAVEAAARFVDRTFWSVRIRARSRGTIKQLSRLDDEILEDIGLPRSEIRAVARKLAETPGFDRRVVRQRPR